MYAARGIAVSFSVFVMVYCVLSIAVCLSWKHVWQYSHRYSARRAADLLFAWRMFPFLTAAVITVAFTVPSFLLLEPRAIDEPLGEIPLVFGLCGAILGVFGIVNTGSAVIRASRTISSWTKHAQEVKSGPVPVLRISRPLPPMTLAGIVSPRVLLSGAAESVLAANELRVALNHELAHVRRRDNLKKLLLRFVPFPQMAALEQAWIEGTEMAADDAAVSNAGEALDLAAALIKLSRMCPAEPAVDLTAALVHNPAAIMNARVARLVTWTETRRVPPQGSSSLCRVAGIAATVTVFVITYSHLLIRIHTATEWMVR